MYQIYKPIYKVGDLEVCNACGKQIQLSKVGAWLHTGSTPRHPGMPKPHWDDRYEERDIEALATIGFNLLIELSEQNVIEAHNFVSDPTTKILLEKYFQKEG